LDLLTNTLIRRDGAGNCCPLHQFTTSSGSITAIVPKGLLQTGISAWPAWLCSWAEPRLPNASRRPADAGVLRAISPAPSVAQARRWASECDLIICVIQRCRQRASALHGLREGLPAQTRILYGVP